MADGTAQVRRPMCSTMDLVVPAVAIAFFRAVWTAATIFAISKSACSPRPGSCPLLSRSIAGVAYISPGLLVEPAFHAFILRRAALDHTQLPVGTPRVAQA